MFELTDEEKQEVQKIFDMFKSPEGELFVKEEAADEIRQEMTAMGLSNYAFDQVMKSDTPLNKAKKSEFIDRAFSAVSKAYSLCPLPIYLYDMACFMEMNGKDDAAKSTFRSFLETQKSFRPSRMQEILLNAQARDIDEAIKDANQKLW